MITPEYRNFIIKRLRLELVPYFMSLAVSIILLLVVTAGFWFIKDRAQSSLDAAANAKEQLRTIDSSMRDAKSSFQTWDNLKEKLATRKGLDVEAFKTLVEKIQSQHAIANLNITLTNPTTRNDSKNNKYINLQQSEITMNFGAITDVDAYRFLNELVSSTPGILHVEKFELTLSKELTPQNLANLQEGKTKGLISVNVNFRWHNFIDL